MISVRSLHFIFSKVLFKNSSLRLCYHFCFAASTYLALVCLLGTLMAPSQSHARPFVLICHEQTTAEECTDFLAKTPEAISYISFIESTTGTVTRDVTQRVFDLQTHHQDRIYSNDLEKDEESVDLNSLIKETSQGFLSTIKKSLLIQLLLLKTSQTNNLNTATRASALPNSNSLKEETKAINPNSPSDPSQQIKVLTKGVMKHPGTLPLSLALYRQDDQLYINGRLIKSENIKTIHVYPHLYYHIAYLSNTYRPSFQWSRGDQIQPFPKQTLVSGDCLNPHWEKGVIETTESTRALFSSACTNVISRSRINATSMLLDQEPPKDLPKSISMNEAPRNFWTKHPIIAIGASILVFSFFQKEFQKTSKANLTWEMNF